MILGASGPKMPSDYTFVSFVSVTDHFPGELEPVANGQVAKDLDMKYEHLVKGLYHVQLRVRAIFFSILFVLMC